MGDVLTFVLAQAATLCAAAGIYMAVTSIPIWGGMCAVGVLFAIGAIISDKAPRATE